MRVVPIILIVLGALILFFSLTNLGTSIFLIQMIFGFILIGFGCVILCLTGIRDALRPPTITTEGLTPLEAAAMPDAVKAEHWRQRQEANEAMKFAIAEAKAGRKCSPEKAVAHAKQVVAEDMAK